MSVLSKYIDRIIPRGLRREEAAIYIGVSPSKFDSMVTDGRMPKPKIIDGRRVWDRHQLDLAFEALPGGALELEHNPWDA
jgi:predicted DNA-binding transcriptional regulator AlpA